MTAINAFAEERRACIVTDCAVYNPDKIITGFHSKVVTLPHLGAAFATSGLVVTGYELARVFYSFESFDDLVGRIAELVRGAWDDGDLRFADDDTRDHFRLFVIGWSTNRKKAELYQLSSQAELDEEPFALISKSGLFTPHIAGGDIDRIMRSSNDNVERLSKIIDVQRAKPLDQGRALVGGCAYLTQVDEAGISQRVLKRWRDRVGEPIDLSTGETPAKART
jgi:hypothetical protein